MAESGTTNDSLFDLNGKIALITGAGRGIGRAISLTLARAGANVALVARSNDELLSAAESIRKLGRRALAFPADLSRTRDLPSLVAEIARCHGRHRHSGQQRRHQHSPGFGGCYRRCLGCHYEHQSQGRLFHGPGGRQGDDRPGAGGRIINISSQTGSVALAKRAAYCASKAGLNLVTKVLAMEWASHEILVNAVAPTFIETEMTKDFLSDPDFRKYALAKNLLKRFGTTDDVAGAVLYLASPVANLITGHVLLVDAGWTAH